MSDKDIRKPIAIALGAALAASVGTVSVAQADAGSPFQMTSLSSGFETTDGHGEGGCGEGKCGGGKEDDKGGEGSCGEGSCGGDSGEGSGGEGGGEGSCGEGKCGGSA